MKKLIVSLALLFASIGAAHAQVYFDSGSARPNNPGAARHAREAPRAVVRPPLVKLQRAEVARIAAALEAAGLLKAGASRAA